MSPTEDRYFDRLDELFRWFVRGHDDEFLAGCTDDLVLNVRGSARRSTLVPRAQIPQWHHSTRQLAGGAFRSSVCFILMTEHTGIVVLTHIIDRNGVGYRYETVNHCTMRDDLMAAWFSYPMSATDYAEAWDLRHRADPLLASRVR